MADEARLNSPDERSPSVAHLDPLEANTTAKPSAESLPVPSFGKQQSGPIRRSRPRIWLFAQTINLLSETRLWDRLPHDWRMRIWRRYFPKGAA